MRAEDIRVLSGDTMGTRYGPSCHSSRVTAETGPAVLQAAAEARQLLFEIAAEMLGVSAGELQSKNGEIYVKSNPSRSLSFRAACSKIDPDEPIRGSGSRAPNPDDPMFSTFGAHAAEVEVDIETGEVKILRIAAAQDFGRAINPKFCVSQIYGGIEFGVGFALSEEGVYDPKTGKMLNNNLHHYRVPMSLDFPNIDTFLVEGEDPYFAYSAKGGAEVTNTPWHERYCYVLPETMNEHRYPWKRYRFPKTFHVSPFIGMNVGYDWRFLAPGQRIQVHMEDYIAGDKLFDATLGLRRKPITGASLLRVLVRYPLMTVQVVTRIHWQALRLWRKGAPFHVHPKKRPKPKGGDL